MYFFIPFIRPCMHHNYSAISESHACRYCVWPIFFFQCKAPYNVFNAKLHTICPGQRVLVVIRFNVTFLHLKHCYEKTSIATCFSKDTHSPTRYGCMLWCSPIVYIRPGSFNTTTAFYFVTECSDIAMFVHLRACHGTTHSYFTWPRLV